jgi:hypothetical protein
MILSTIEFRSDSISELDGKRRTVTISRNDMNVISLRHGFSVERPIAHAIIGIGLVALGFVLGVRPLYLVVANRDFGPEPCTLDIFAYAVPLILLGGYFIYSMMIKRYFLLVLTKSGTKRKLVFRGKLSFGEVCAFVMNCNSAFGYQVQIEKPLTA